ncbi:MAG TPA: GNAT family N-acetyltransferase [Burkholderiaceae bacterium]|nr:GNAT family N-acetyltransferase [Burkholderiaceae bacterium]
MLDSTIKIRLASPQDAHRIAAMSRDLIEQGLGWSWKDERVLRSIRDKDTNVAVACDASMPVGFGIMKYKEEEGHLMLFAVRDSHRRRGIGSTLMAWFERTALVAGIGVIRLEARLANGEARAFYHRLGYAEIKIVRGYYCGVESAVRLAKDLWA